LRIRAVPAALQSCVDDADLSDLIERLLPWLGMRDREGHSDEARPEVALGVIADTRDRRDPAPLLARRWMEEVLADKGELDQVPGLRRWSALELVRGSS
jgi:hypothetical protein